MNRYGCCCGPKITIAIFTYKQSLRSIDMKTKVVHHVPRINISIWHKTCDMWHATCDMQHVTSIYKLEHVLCPVSSCVQQKLNKIILDQLPSNWAGLEPRGRRRRPENEKMRAHSARFFSCYKRAAWWAVRTDSPLSHIVILLTLSQFFKTM